MPNQWFGVFGEHSTQAFDFFSQNIQNRVTLVHSETFKFWSKINLGGGGYLHVHI